MLWPWVKVLWSILAAGLFFKKFRYNTRSGPVQIDNVRLFRACVLLLLVPYAPVHTACLPAVGRIDMHADFETRLRLISLPAHLPDAAYS